MLVGVVLLVFGLAILVADPSWRGGVLLVLGPTRGVHTSDALVLATSGFGALVLGSGARSGRR